MGMSNSILILASNDNKATIIKKAVIHCSILQISKYIQYINNCAFSTDQNNFDNDICHNQSPTLLTV